MNRRSNGKTENGTKGSSFFQAFNAKLILAICILSIVTWMGGNPEFKIDRNKLSVISFMFPDSAYAWSMIGEGENIKIDNDGITISSLVPRPARVFRDIYIGQPKGHFLQPDILFASARIQPLNAAVDTSLISIPSRFHIQQRERKTGRRFHLFAHTPFTSVRNSDLDVTESRKFAKAGFEPISVEGISRHTTGADTLRVSMVLHSAGAWRLEQLDLYKGKFRKSYLLFLFSISFLWLFLLIALITTFAKGSNFRGALVVFSLSAVVMLAVVPLPIGLVSGEIKEVMVRFTPGRWSGVVDSITPHVAHFLSHFTFTLLLLFYLRKNSYVGLSVVLINIGLALSIESWQSHASFRSAELIDVFAAMVGAVAALSVGLVLKALNLFSF